MGHGDYLEIANMQVLKICDADDFMIVVMVVISTIMMDLKISDDVQDVGADSDFYNDDGLGDGNNPQYCSSKLRSPILLQL